MGPGKGAGGSGIAPAPVICLSCLQKKTEISGCLFEGPDFPPEIRKPEATRQRKRQKKTGLEKPGHKRGGLVGKQWSAWKMRPWNTQSNCAVLGTEVLE